MRMDDAGAPMFHGGLTEGRCSTAVCMVLLDYFAPRPASHWKMENFGSAARLHTTPSMRGGAAWPLCSRSLSV